MDDAPKRVWVETSVDAVVRSIDKLARAHALNDERAAEDARSKLWSEMRTLILALDTRTHVRPG